MSQAHLYLLAAIICEVIGTSALKQSAGFTKILPNIIAFIAYVSTFFFLSQALKDIPLNVAYAIWAGLGTLGIALIGWFIFKEPFSWMAALGSLLVIAGVILLNLSGLARH
jgi:small multidrug resistance pump